ncbi:ACP S-malonyltransferase [Paenibacillus taiwanensis]|uniref:ACP S-malonyltransferase n=1 Tax=Paenibacillus taiwanensis TaxID=401638 RepID=UPI00040F2209|nr:ACP S-malonyltransferase [Paenibacillus taiwanensis]
MDHLSHKQLAFLFQGVGANYQHFLDKFEEAQLNTLRHYCCTVKEELEIDLLAHLFPASEMNQMEYDKMFCDWIAIYTCDYIVYQQYVDAGIKPAIMVGYSMGLITAMACSKSISFAAGLHMLRVIYDYPKGAAVSYSMGVIVGKTNDEIRALIAQCAAEKDVYIASENNDTCLVISGIQNSVSQVLTIAEQEGAIKASTINTPYAFHSPFAARGIDRFVKLVEETSISDGEVPILSVFTQTLLQNASHLKQELIKNMASPMNWNASILALGKMGIENFVEVSLDDSLTKISKMIHLEYEFMTYKKFKRQTSARRVLS